MEAKLYKYFGFESFREGQKEVITNLMNGKSSIAIFPTGAGKSLCYQLPAILLPKLTLVVSPLLSLMKDQLDFLLSHNISAAKLDSTLSRDEYNSIMQKAKSGQLKILMISVERFKNERFRYHLQKMDISLLVIDEAHCISEWGHNFRPEYLKIPAYQKEFNIKQVLLLTATATKEVISDMCKKLNISDKNVTTTGFYRKNLFLQITAVKESEKNSVLLNRIKEAPDSPTIVYVTLQKTASNVSNFLCENKINAQSYHAGMKNEERERIQNEFMAGNLNCIVATIAFGMGIDKKDIRRVIHYDLPKSIENYSQEIGRSGRDGKKSFCEVLANRDSVNVLENFIYGDTPSKNSISQLLNLIKNNQTNLFEIKTKTLSNELNIRMLPLKTLLVYLDIEGIISPKNTYFEDYSFKYNSNPESIINKFKDERKNFIQNIFKNCRTKKIWTTVDMMSILKNYKTDRKRVIAALEYFGGNKWIELQAKQAIDVYFINNKEFEIEPIANKISLLFQNKEKAEILRIHNMISFFESNSCLSQNLAQYFGDFSVKENCNHCSFCLNGKTNIPNSITLKPLNSFNFKEISSEFTNVIDKDFTILNLTKFLCGITIPLFTKLKIKKLQNFGLFEKYPFRDIKIWIENNTTN